MTPETYLTIATGLLSLGAAWGSLRSRVKAVETDVKEIRKDLKTLTASLNGVHHLGDKPSNLRRGA